MNRTHKVDKKKGSFVTTFTPGVKVIKISKLAYFLYSLLMTAKSQSEYGQNF